ncbi:hypothetical protein NNJEOMEG_03065 [Fundidesulfovibrio magnetotacticus]|uniref:Uncharacterized protein n=1 Tax=Fundidesulfovibrio magnetotacticus TaxID=2730080 RepID=A0A6V8M011_9BACT|nr:hypothetical protein [Fundidesulfovibrio magnetotacticus]GFK95207.1 hypothetical protein NNJEOMEG_03065 [Fundidesulfovibrio magnetotacticus]
MKDERGLYYYPAPQNTAIRMYVRESFDVIEFRMFNREYPEVWERHGWIPYEEIEMAAEMYKQRGRGTNPLELYDLDVARRLLIDEGGSAR